MRANRVVPLNARNSSKKYLNQGIMQAEEPEEEEEAGIKKSVRDPVVIDCRVLGSRNPLLLYSLHYTIHPSRLRHIQPFRCSDQILFLNLYTLICIILYTTYTRIEKRENIHNHGAVEWS